MTSRATRVPTWSWARAGTTFVCGDAADPLVTGGGGSDVPCPVVEGTFNATSGSVTIDLGNGIRELDDEFLEVKEDGTANPWELVILIAPTKGTLTLVGDTVTYLVNAGATGSDFFEYTLRRKVIACPGDITVTFQGEEQTVNLCDGDILRAGAVISVSGIDYVQSGSKRITLTLQTPPPPPPVPPGCSGASGCSPRDRWRSRPGARRARSRRARRRRHRGAEAALQPTRSEGLSPNPHEAKRSPYVSTAIAY